jgi:hypothetical protein
MKKFLVFIFAVALFASCQKEEASAPVAQEVVFSGIDSGAKKSTNAEPCENAQADYAKVVIDNETYRPAVFYIDGVAYTQAIKLIPAQYTVQEFMLLNNNGTPEDLTDDYIVKAAPMTGSEYADFVTAPLTFTFDVEGFKKAEVPVEVLCFDEAEYEAFGFNWFAMTEITVREQVFFGDLCVADLSVYENSLYAEQMNGLQIDMPAIFKVDVYKNGAFVKSYTNEAWLGEGEPLKVQYPDHDNAADAFDFELHILVENGGEFVYQLFHTWSFNDDEMIADGGDGVVDFVLGSCNFSETDLQLEWPCGPAFHQGFETGIEGWIDEKVAGSEAYGRITRTASSNAPEGSYIAIFEETTYGPFTRFDAYSDVWTGTWSAEVDIYLDPSMTDGEGFDYSVAANGTDNQHQRDFIFHVSKDISVGALLVGGSNNSSNSTSRQDLETINHYEVTAAGWYTLQHVFRNEGGVLAVDLNLLDSNGNVLFTETRTDGSDLIPSVVGGNRYGWFTFIDVTGGIMVDETKLTRTCN